MSKHFTILFFLLFAGGCFKSEPYYEQFVFNSSEAIELFQGQVVITGTHWADGFKLVMIFPDHEKKHTIKDIGGHFFFKHLGKNYRLNYLGIGDDGYRISVAEVR